MPAVQEKLGLRRSRFCEQRGTFEMQVTATRPKIMVAADGRGVVSHVSPELSRNAMIGWTETVFERRASVLLLELAHVRAELCKVAPAAHGLA